ncbi:hypothetical protein ACLOJK_023370, partial [Asimina triloba]
MASRQCDEQGKGKAPSASRETSTARPCARRAPTNANKLDQVIERVIESRMAQEAIRLELVSKLETLQISVADVTTFVMKINEEQTLQDAEMTFLRRRLEALQTQLNETSLGKRKAETSPDPVPRRRVKMAVSKKRPTYPNPEDEEPVEEIPPQEEGSKESPVAPEDPESENSGNGGAAGPSRNPGKRRQGSTLHEWLTQVLTQLDVLQRRFDENSQQQRSEGVVQGQAVMGTQTRERVATHGRAANIDDQTYGGHRVERLPRKEQDRKDANAFHQQHPPSFSGGDNTEAENWLLAINRILEFFDCPDRQRYCLLHLNSKVMQLKQSSMSVAEYEIKFSALTRFAPNLVTDDEARIRRFQNGLDESIRDMVMTEPYGKAVDRAMWAEKAVAQFSKMFMKRKGEAVEGESSSKKQTAQMSGSPAGQGSKSKGSKNQNQRGAISDAAISNQGLVISAKKPDTDQRTALVEWYFIGFVLRREHLAHSSRETKTDHQDDRQQNVQSPRGRQQANVFALNPGQAQVS